MLRMTSIVGTAPFQVSFRVKRTSIDLNRQPGLSLVQASRDAS